jgi:hypothetical protein
MSHNRLTEALSSDGRTLVAVASDAGELSGDTRFEFEEDGRIYAHYSGGVSSMDISSPSTAEHVRDTQRNSNRETANGHSVGTVELLDDGRVRVEET